MTDLLFDTTVLIDAYFGHTAAEDFLSGARSDPQSVAMSAISVFELWLKEIDREEELFHASAVSALPNIPVSATIARQAAGWLRRYPRQQRQALAADAMIAATAASVGATIITRNPRDFMRFYANVQSY